MTQIALVLSLKRFFEAISQVTIFNFDLINLHNTLGHLINRKKIFFSLKLLFNLKNAKDLMIHSTVNSRQTRTTRNLFKYF
ncbi:hypothetical protein T4D_15968 [Trichinella pseudospiralis]|uniref:Uncharacterized protein n=1 Tax=Trichinella pseudospiralis TaxID=6337 RepID=A0A0V1FVC8_TRIPS|nr:hypothetical protein T4D_15968 [Trichinella pseudospiralis]